MAKSRRRFYFLQHDNLLRKKVVIRATNDLNLQRNIVARQVARKMLPVSLGLKRSDSGPIKRILKFQSMGIKVCHCFT